MSTLRTTNIQHGSAGNVNNIVLNASGDVTIASGLLMSSGTAAAPAGTFTDDVNTGIYSPAADTIAITTSGTERVRVASDGRVILATAANCPGIAWDDNDTTGANVDSRTLDDYEEGTWAPALFERVNGAGNYIEVTDATYSTDFNGGWYQRVGNTVKFGGVLRLTSKGSITGSDHVGIGGFPYAAKALAVPYGEQRAAAAVYIATNISTTSNRVLALQAPIGGDSWIQLYWMDWDTGTNAAVVGTDIDNATYLVSFAGHYITD
jgi:hypothetical protein